jgi:hypothetical protein
MGKFIVVYVNNILIYSLTLKSHLEHLRVVFNTLRKKLLYVNRKSVSSLLILLLFWVLLCLLMVFRLIKVRFL